MHDIKEIKVQPPYKYVYQNMNWKTGNCDTFYKIFTLKLHDLYECCTEYGHYAYRNAREKSPLVSSPWKKPNRLS